MPTIYKRGQSFYLTYYDRGQRRKKSLGKVTRREAEKHLAAKSVELSTGVNPLAIGPPFEQFAQSYLSWHKGEYPSSHYRVAQIVEQHLIPAFAWTPIDAIRIEDVERYKAARSAKAATITKEVRTLKAVINKGVEWGYVQTNPIRSVSGPRILDARPVRWFDVDEMRQIYDASPRPAIWQLMANTGIRRGEALALDWRHVGADEVRIVSSEHERTKSGRWRLIPLSDGARAALETLRRGRGRVLPEIRPRSLSRWFEQDLRAADVEGTLHDLRHTFCSHLVMSGTPLRTVQALAGHSTVKVTERYAHLSPDYLRGAVAGLRI